MTKKTSAGYSLLEMLVVFVIVGLISSLLLQGLTYILQLRLRFLDAVKVQQADALREYWFRSVSRAVLPDQPEGSHGFQGDDRGFSGLTVAALQAPAGLPTPFAWRLDYRKEEDETWLQYQEDGQESSWGIMSWRGDVGSFLYLGEDETWYSEWPPPTLEKTAQLPAAIGLRRPVEGEPAVWFVTLQGRREPRPEYDE